MHNHPCYWGPYLFPVRSWQRSDSFPSHIARPRPAKNRYPHIHTPILLLQGVIGIGVQSSLQPALKLRASRDVTSRRICCHRLTSSVPDSHPLSPVGSSERYVMISSWNSPWRPVVCVRDVWTSCVLLVARPPSCRTDRTLPPTTHKGQPLLHKQEPSSHPGSRGV
ncbi:MAG: hypothetical protein KatS3mg114_0620 [Planctomycetaceae bacterium]|nr:MAG: hypothetical protein KatS3mg114_0620 [Planctomycetaceae bacterium]